MTTNPSATLAQIAIDRPRAPGVFTRHGLDFCCHGQRSLAEACAEKGLEPRAVIEELDRAEAAEPEAERWEARPLGELIDFILARYHAPLRTEVAGLVELAGKVERVHAEKPTCPHGLASHLAQVLDALMPDMGNQLIVHSIVKPLGGSDIVSAGTPPVRVHRRCAGCVPSSCTRVHVLPVVALWSHFSRQVRQDILRCSMPMLDCK